MDEIIKLVEEARFPEAIEKILLLPEGPEVKKLWKVLAEKSAEKHEFQISEYAWTRAFGLRIRMNLIVRDHE